MPTRAKRVSISYQGLRADKPARDVRSPWFSRTSMPTIGRRRTEGPDGDDDPQPCIGALGIISLAHPLDHLARLCHGIIAMLRDPLMSGAVDVEVGGRHAAVVMAKPGKGPPRRIGEKRGGEVV